jgi:hypothetical protein
MLKYLNFNSLFETAMNLTQPQKLSSMVLKNNWGLKKQFYIFILLYSTPTMLNIYSVDYLHPKTQSSLIAAALQRLWSAVIWSAVLSLRKQAQHRFVRLKKHSPLKNTQPENYKSLTLLWFFS